MGFPDGRRDAGDAEWDEARSASKAIGQWRVGRHTAHELPPAMASPRTPQKMPQKPAAISLAHHGTVPPCRSGKGPSALSISTLLIMGKTKRDLNH